MPASVIEDLFSSTMTFSKLPKNAFIKSFNINKGLGLVSGAKGWLNFERNACDLRAKKGFSKRLSRSLIS